MLRSFGVVGEWCIGPNAGARGVVDDFRAGLLVTRFDEREVAGPPAHFRSEDGSTGVEILRRVLTPPAAAELRWRDPRGDRKHKVCFFVRFLPSSSAVGARRSSPSFLSSLHYARRDLALEVAIEVLAVEDIADLTAEAVLFDDDFAPIFDLPPRGYARAYEQAAG